MEHKQYQLRFLPIFEEDLAAAVQYITYQLQNPLAAQKLINDTEQAIVERSTAPCAFQPYPTARRRKHPYYQIRIRNYSVFYVVIDDVMEVRRFLYNKRNLYNLL